MTDFASRLAQAMINHKDYAKQNKSWYRNKSHDEITAELDQSQLSRDTGIPTYTLNKHLKRRQKPHMDDLKMYAQALGVSADWLIGITKRMESIDSVEVRVVDTKVISCEGNKQTDLYNKMQETITFTGFEENTPYPELIKDLFCIGASNSHEKPSETVNLLMKLFYMDYLFFLLTITSSSSLVQSEFFKNNVKRNIKILNYLFLLLPHKLNSRIDSKLQIYVTSLLELEIRPHTRQSIENLFCLTTLSFFWLSNQQSFSMILALKHTGTQVVVDLVNHLIREQNLPLRPIRVSTIDNQEQLHIIRKQIRQIIAKHLV